MYTKIWSKTPSCKYISYKMWVIVSTKSFAESSCDFLSVSALFFFWSRRLHFSKKFSCFYYRSSNTWTLLTNSQQSTLETTFCLILSARIRTLLNSGTFQNILSTTKRAVTPQHLTLPVVESDLLCPCSLPLKIYNNSFYRRGLTHLLFPILTCP